MRKLTRNDGTGTTHRLIGSLIGIALVVSAAVAVWISRDDLRDALAAIERPSPVLIIAALVLPLLNWLVISFSIAALYLPTARIGFREMISVVATAWLLNYLPMRPGMVGRFAYHRQVNKIPLRISAKVLVQGVALSMVSAAGLLAIAIMLIDRQDLTVWAPTVLGVAVVLGAGSFVTRAKRPNVSALLAAGTARWLDMLLWSARYWVAFALIGSPIDISHAVVFACVAQVVLLVPLTGNGMGFREWAIGLFAHQFATLAVTVGLAADLVNRVAELVVAIPTGLIAWTVVSRRLARMGADSRATSESTQTE